MQRDEMISRLEEQNNQWDIVVIGGGATGMGTAVDAASRGYQTLLLEQGDFAQGTSSRSTKLVHGGVRYLQQGNISLVLEALKERGILRRNAPHLVHNLPFIVPNYDWWEGPFYGVGLKIYDMLAGKEGFGRSEIISKEDTIQHIPTVETDGLNGGVRYYDGQFDDARLVINLASTASRQGAAIINYIPVVDFLKNSGMITGVVARDLESGKEYQIRARAVINATGPFSDKLRMKDETASKPMIQASQGIHLVLDQSFLPGDSAIMVPHTDDGRVLFAIPWHGRIVIGTTDTPIKEAEIEPVPLREEIDFLLAHTARYLTKDPTESDILSVFAGVRPLVTSPDEADTASLSRDHVLNISRSGLITIAGGKWTTYRKMAEDTVEKAILIGQLDLRPCVTETLQIHGYHNSPQIFGVLHNYGSDAIEIENLKREEKSLREILHPGLNITAAEVVWAVREEMARTVDDFLGRRSRALFLDARAAIEIIEVVAELMRHELNQDAAWKTNQIQRCQKIAANYLP
ncbi:MAG: glycerol-3-phosphate dehydrogenase/oxidase [Calditrichales bacterium]|nr:MAG: glycerol-3-phosphate dehydrogenase/oxidase [Calditrichales bacterium]